MKRTLFIITFLIFLGGYIIFIHKQSEFIAGENRIFTIYEEYKARVKSYDFTAIEYKNDIYHLETVKNNLDIEIDDINKYRQKLIFYSDSINLNYNTVTDFDRYIINIDKLKFKIDSSKAYLSDIDKEIHKLNKFIYKVEPNMISVKLYNSNIQDISLFLKSIDSITIKYNKSLSILKGIAEIKNLKLQKNILEEKEIERQNLIAEIERHYGIQNLQNENDSKYSISINNSDYLSNSSYLQVDNLSLSTYSSPNSTNYSSEINTLFQTNTNSNIEIVRGYQKSNGTIVEPYKRTVKNNTEIDNFSHIRNINPFTGEIGTKR